MDKPRFCKQRAKISSAQTTKKFSLLSIEFQFSGQKLRIKQTKKQILARQTVLHSSSQAATWVDRRVTFQGANLRRPFNFLLSFQNLNSSCDSLRSIFTRRFDRHNRFKGGSQQQ